MNFIIESIFFPFATISVLITLICAAYFKYYAFQYWSKRNVPFLPPTIPAGNIGNALIGKQSLGDVVKDIYNVFKNKDCKHAGLYIVNSPVYMPIDPDIIKTILVKDFQYFVDRGVFYDEVNEPLTAHLFSLEGTKWKNLRAKLSPTFTSGKMKMMFGTLVDCSEELKIVCDKASQTEECLDIKDILARYTTDVIGSCAFGLECNSLKNPDAEFRKMGRKVLDLNTWEAAKMFIAVGFPSLAKAMKIKLFDQNASHFFMEAIKHTIDYREQNNITRNDFLQLLIQLKNQGCLEENENCTKQEVKLTFNEVAAQAFVFFLAGFETTATTLTFALFELACNTDIQNKVREEVVNILKAYNGKLTYDGIMKMTYMEKIIQETLRKYPPVLILNRQCTTKQYKVSNTNVVLEQGTNVFIPIYGLHKDPQHYPDPEKFDPERFNDENKAKRHLGVYLPFGEGPRICIGLRFGVMQVKVGLAVLLSRYIVSLNEKTKIPLKFFPKSLILIAEGGIWLNVNKIQ